MFLSPQLPCVMMMMMMLVAQAAPQKLQGKVGTHHKPESQDNSLKYYIINLEHEIKPASHSIRPINNDSISPWEYM